VRFVGDHRDRFGVEPILRVLEIPVSTCYGWLAQQRDPCQRQCQDAWLLDKIRAVHGRSGGTYGAPRVHAQLRRDGICSSRKRVARLLGQAGLQGAFVRKRWRCSTRQDPKAIPAPDLVNRDFTAPAPTRLWVADLSRIPTGEGRCGWPACATPSRGGSSAGRPRIGPIPSWCWARWSTPSGAAAWTVTLPNAGSSTTRTGAPSTPRSASPNALPTPGSSRPWARSATASTPPWPRPSCSTLKVELVYRTSFRTREEAELALFRYVDGW
jgi:putative transposase